MAKAKKTEKSTNLNMSFENALKKALNTPLPKSSTNQQKKDKKDKKK